MSFRGDLLLVFKLSCTRCAVTERDRTWAEGAQSLHINDAVSFAHAAISGGAGGLVMSEFGSDHGVNENLGRILSKYAHLTHSFDIYDTDEMKMILSAW
jgi:hypothetical protein